MRIRLKRMFRRFRLLDMEAEVLLPGHGEKIEMNSLAGSHTSQAVKGGLGIATAAIFLAGEMAGSGVLALPYALLGTGWTGLFLIAMFTVNSLFSGTRLGLCWVMLEERYEEFRGHVRDPYPCIGEKAVGRWGRIVSLVAICITLYGGGCVFIVLIAQLLGSLVGSAGFHLTLCTWMVIVAVCLIPLTWAGTPKDFWPIAVGALLTTVTACIIIIIKVVIDGNELEQKVYPPPTFQGFLKAFGSIMFAFAGASTFPTIQADMKNRSQFNYAAVIAILILFLIYFPMAAGGYFALGELVQDNIVLSMSDGWERVVVEIMLLLHLVSAFPIITNPPAQIFEEILSIPSDFNWKRCVFRSISVLILLFVAESVPSFGAILNLVGASTVTLLTFVFPPFFYMKIADATIGVKGVPERRIPVWERVYCWGLIVIGILGGACATYNAMSDIVATSLSVPCYLMSADANITISSSH
ncbi:amino acid transporter ANT1 isoform X2 [Eurytemora carolleeae]|uniref:amino acid transporter ANT1 isoform X2 n=1 Tax=Eurytemora carolleeae TaxID=1294199 RepID=UPI000C775C88|nr:amino acid transporter ANT1 isoform X2 [Eurytemora carolleeae]|eukprot:XP_023326958.1 amino acid transporter ANT1-like isoform X2 [Eurytemora affinis]